VTIHYHDLVPAIAVDEEVAAVLAEVTGTRKTPLGQFDRVDDLQVVQRILVDVQYIDAPRMIR
jgi:hypothetical protein